MNIIPGIYLIKNLTNGRGYVGSSSNIAKRLSEHKRLLGLGQHYNIRLQRAWVKYGPDQFVFDILEPIPDLAQLLDAEDRHIKALGKLAYNFREAAKGRQFHSAESRAKISASKKGKPKSPEHVAKMAASKRGSKASDATRQKMRDSHMGHGVSIITRDRIRASKMGKRTSDETKEKIRQANARCWANGRRQSPEAIAKMREASRRYWDEQMLKKAEAKTMCKGETKEL